MICKFTVHPFNGVHGLNKLNRFEKVLVRSEQLKRRLKYPVKGYPLTAQEMKDRGWDKVHQTAMEVRNAHN